MHLRKCHIALLFAVAAVSAHADSVVMFNEIMYHPAGDAQELEWVELFNGLSYDVDISGWQLDGGIEYTFPDGTIIPSEGYVVIAKSPTALEAASGVTNAFGPFSGQLSNGGEAIRIENNSGRDMDEVNYGDGGDWPVAPDGSGASLAKIDPFTSSPPPGNWHFSRQLDGTPGAVNFPGGGGPVVTTLVDRDGSWYYDDTGVDLGTAWRAPGYDASSWSNGQAFFNSNLGSGGGYLITNGLVQRYRAESITGLSDNDVVGTWSDLALDDGTAQDATSADDPRFFGNVVNGKAVIRFDGATDEMRTALTPGIGPTDGFVYFIVLKANASPANGTVTDGSGDYIFDRESSPNGNPLVSLKAVSGRFGYQSRYDNGSGLGGPVSTTTISQTGFQIVTLRRNRTAGQFEIWVNGTLEAFTTDNGSDLTPSPVNIGRHATSTTGGFIGDIAEVLIYNRELEDTELQSTGSFLADEYDIDTGFEGIVGRTPLSPATSTCYFRKSFVLDGDPTRTTLSLASWIADGVVCYLNGQEVHRANMPGGAIAFSTAALTDIADPFTPSYATPSVGPLLAGANVLAVEVHRASGGTNIFFGSELQGTETVPDPTDVPPLAINEIEGVTNAAWWIELANLSGTSLNPTGYVVSISADPAREYTITNTSLSAGGFLVLSQAELGFTALDEDPVFLYRPGNAGVTDARVAKRSLRGRHDTRWLRPSSPTPGLTNVFTLSDAIVINEIMYHHQATNDSVTFAESSEEWIELYNRGTGTVDLSGWKLDGGVGFDFGAGTTLDAGAYLVVSNFSGQLSNRGEAIVLEDATGNPADEVHYIEGGRWPSFADGGGSSLELRDPDADNSVPEAWAASDEGRRATWRTYTNRATAASSSVGPDNQWKEFVLGLLDSGEVLLDDISIIEDPDGAATELISTGDFESGIGDWRIIGNHRHSEVITDPDDGGNQALRLVASGATEHMHNHAEITLAGGQSVNNGTEYEIAFRAKWIGGCRLLNTRLYFNRTPETFVLDVPMTNGTPGAVNSTYVTNIGPTYAEFSHEPVVPDNSEPVTVSVLADDPDGVATVKTWYAVDGGAWQQVVMTGLAGEYTAIIPAQAAASVVQFYVEGIDGPGAISTFPSRGSDSRALYKVDDGLASSTLHNFRIAMTPADADFLDTDIQLMSNEQLGCTVIFRESDVYYDVGARYKGSERGRVSDSRIGFKIGFNADQLFLEAHGSVAIDRSAGQSVGQREMLINQVMNRGGGDLSKYTDLIKVLAPKNEHTSAAELQLARFGDVFLGGQFENGRDGTMIEYELIYYPTSADAQGYKRPSPDSVVGTVINDKGDDKENYRWPFLMKNHRARDDYSDFIAFAKVFGLSGTSFNEQVGDVADVDQWLRYMAYAVADGHGDSYPSGSNRHNTMFYVRSEDGRVLFFPHDMDFSYSTTRALVPNSDLGKLIGTPGRERLYYGHMWDILSTAYNATYMQTWTDRFGALLPSQNFASYLSFISSRHDFLVGEINERVAPAYPFAVTTPSGLTYPASDIDVEGDAWIDVREIYLDGQSLPLDPSWSSAGSGSSTTYSWLTTVPLEPGSNTLTFLAYDFQGVLLGSNTITAYSSVLERPLQDNLKITELMVDPAGGSDYEFIELYNAGDEALDMTNVRFTAGIDFDFGAAGFTTLGTGTYCVVVGDPVAFGTRYDTNGIVIAGTFSGKLANGGETIEILGPHNAEVLRFGYQSGRGWPLAADGAGHSLIPTDLLNQQAGSLDYSGNWRASAYIGGSPGEADPEPIKDVVLNEIAAHTDYSNAAKPEYDSNDWLELYNTKTAGVSLANWYMSDSASDLKKWAIPVTNTIASEGWKAFDEVTGFHSPITNGFGLDKAGEEVFLSHLPGTSEDRVADCIRFKGQENGVTLGRYTDGDDYWYTLAPTRSAANGVPGSHLVISEIMYHPEPTVANPENNTNDEYVKIYNPLFVPVELWTTAGRWRINGGIGYTFPSNTTIAAEDELTVVSFDPVTNITARDEFLAHYDLDIGDVTMLGPYSGQLDNQSDRIALEKPIEPDPPDTDVPWVIIDEVIYYDSNPWPTAADGMGPPLYRADLEGAGSDPDSWSTAPPTADAFVITSLSISGGTPLVTWEGLTNGEWYVERSTNLSEGFTRIATSTVSAVYHDTALPGSATESYYRIAAILNTITVYTRNTAGYFQLTVPSNGYSLVSVPYQKFPLYRGTVTSNTTLTITDYGASWTAGEFARGAAGQEPTGTNSFYVEIRDKGNPYEGKIFPITTNTATELQIEGGAAAGLTTGALATASYAIVPYQRVRDIFGEPDSPLLVGGGAVQSADNILFWSGTSWQRIYNKDSGNPSFLTNHWLLGSTVVDDKAIGRDSSFFLYRQATSNTVLHLTGEVPAFEQWIDLDPGYNLVGGCWIEPVSVGDTSLQGTLNGGDNPEEADTILEWGGSSWLGAVYYKTSGNPPFIVNHWVRGTTVMDSSFTFMPGKGYFIKNSSSNVWHKARTWNE
jgi:hypothetical protein